jgi:hypothetical protein
MEIYEMMNISDERQENREQVITRYFNRLFFLTGESQKNHEISCLSYPVR